MRIVNLTKSELNLPFKNISDILPKTISKDIVITRDMVKSYMVPLANVHQQNIVFIVNEIEKYKFNDIFSVFPLINLRDYSDLIEYNKGDEIPVGSSIVIDNYYINPITGKVESKEFILLPAVQIADAKPGWEDPANPGIGNGNVRFFTLLWDEYVSLTPVIEDALYFIIDKRVIYKGSTPYSNVNDINDLVEVLNKKLADLGMTDSTIPTSKAVVDYINHRFETAISGVEYRGLIDANNPTENQYWIDALHGYMFRISVSGTIDGIELGVGDTIIINKNVTGVPTKDDMDVIPYTLDEIGDIKLLNTNNKTNLVSAINEINENLPRWEGITK